MGSPNQAVVSVDLLRPNPFNSNIVSPDNEGKLVASMKQLGFFKPIVVRYLPDAASKTDYEILGGEHRWQGARLIGLTEVPIFDVGPVSDEIAKKISLADNARYGIDDSAKLAELLESMEDGRSIQEIMPFSDTDISAIFSSTSIVLDDLDLSGFEENASAEPDEPKPERAPKTHTIMRFKVTLADAERITALIAAIKKRQGFTTSDDLTNAGDALVHQLFGAGE